MVLISPSWCVTARSSRDSTEQEMLKWVVAEYEIALTSIDGFVISVFF